MNIIDVGILALVALCALAGYRKGLIRTVYRLASFFIAMIIANLFYPHVSRALRLTTFYDAIQSGIKSGLNLENFAAAHSANVQSEVIDSLMLPAPIGNFLQKYFQENVHGVLRVETIEEYVSGFFANIVINAIAIILVFFAALVLLGVIGIILDIVGDLPVISTVNRLGGLLVGILLGAGISWLAIVGLSMLFASSTSPEVLELLENSFAGSRVMQHLVPRLASAT